MRLEKINFTNVQPVNFKVNKAIGSAYTEKTVDEPIETNVKFSKNNMAALGVNFRGYIDPKLLDANRILVKAQGLLGAANSQKTHSETVLAEALDVFDEVRDVVRLGQIINFSPIENADGKLAVSFDFYDENSFIMNEFGENGQIIRQSFFDENLDPTEILEYSENSNYGKSYSYFDEYGEIRVSEYVLREKEFCKNPHYSLDIKEYENYYEFDNFELKYYQGDNVISDGYSEEISETYDYCPDECFEIPNADLVVYKNEITNSKGFSNAQEVFVYDENGKLIAYEQNRKQGPNNFIPACYDRLAKFENDEIISCYENK